MTILDRYIARSIGWSSLFVTLILLTLFIFVDFIGELRHVGRNDYGVAQAMIYVILTLPELLYQLFPVLALLGTLVGLALLANHGELIAIRAAGVSVWRILGSVSLIGIVFIVLSFALGEWLAPKSDVIAERYKKQLTSGKVNYKTTKSGYWLRNGNNFVHVEKEKADGRPGGVRILTIDSETLELKKSLRASTMIPLEQGWELSDVDIIELSMAGISKRHSRILPWQSLPEPAVMEAASTRPEELSTLELWRYIQFLKDNGNKALAYEQTLYSKLIMPLTIAVMVAIAFPFVFGSLRSAGIGHYIFIGACIGIGFHLFNELFRYSGLVYGLPPLLSATVPTLFFLLVAIYMLRRVF